jgi:predicted Fe-Mo cluster-binding NifX family protein
MAKHKISLEVKTKLGRPELDGIVGASLRSNPDADEIVVICKEASREAYKAVSDYGIKITIVCRK